MALAAKVRGLEAEGTKQTITVIGLAQVQSQDRSVGMMGDFVVCYSWREWSWRERDFREDRP